MAGFLDSPLTDAQAFGDRPTVIQPERLLDAAPQSFFDRELDTFGDGMTGENEEASFLGKLARDTGRAVGTSIPGRIAMNLTPDLGFGLEAAANSPQELETPGPNYGTILGLGLDIAATWPIFGAGAAITARHVSAHVAQKIAAPTAREIAFGQSVAWGLGLPSMEILAGADAETILLSGALGFMAPYAPGMIGRGVQKASGAGAEISQRLMLKAADAGNRAFLQLPEPVRMEAIKDLNRIRSVASPVLQTLRVAARDLAPKQRDKIERSAIETMNTQYMHWTHLRGEGKGINVDRFLWQVGEDYLPGYGDDLVQVWSLLGKDGLLRISKDPHVNANFKAAWNSYVDSAMPAFFDRLRVGSLVINPKTGVHTPVGSMIDHLWTAYRGFATSSLKALDSMGPAGKVIAKTLDTTNRDLRRQQKTYIHRFMRGLVVKKKHPDYIPDADLENFAHTREALKGASIEEKQAVYAALPQWAKDLWMFFDSTSLADMRMVGVSVKTLGGAGESFPHMWDYPNLQKWFMEPGNMDRYANMVGMGPGARTRLFQEFRAMQGYRTMDDAALTPLRGSPAAGGGEDVMHALKDNPIFDMAMNHERHLRSSMDTRRTLRVTRAQAEELGMPLLSVRQTTLAYMDQVAERVAVAKNWGPNLELMVGVNARQTYERGWGHVQRSQAEALTGKAGGVGPDNLRPLTERHFQREAASGVDVTNRVRAGRKIGEDVLTGTGRTRITEESMVNSAGRLQNNAVMDRLARTAKGGDLHGVPPELLAARTNTEAVGGLLGEVYRQNGHDNVAFKAASELAMRGIGIVPPMGPLSKLLRPIQANVMVPSKLGLAVISNAGQSVNTIADVGFKNWWDAVKLYKSIAKDIEKRGYTQMHTQGSTLRSAAEAQKISRSIMRGNRGADDLQRLGESRIRRGPPPGQGDNIPMTVKGIDRLRGTPMQEAGPTGIMHTPQGTPPVRTDTLQLLGPEERQGINELRLFFEEQQLLHKHLTQTIQDVLSRGQLQASAGQNVPPTSKFMSMIGADSSKTLGHYFLEWSGFTTVERLNRLTAALAGRRWMEKNFHIALTQRNTPELTKHAKMITREFKALGVDLKNAVERGYLTHDDYFYGALKVSDRTQFQTRPTDLPLFWSSPEARVFRFLKTFSFQQSKFLKDRVIKRGIKGMKEGNVADMRPLMAFGTIFPATGMFLGDIRSIVKAREPEHNKMFAEEYVEGIGWVGGLGLMGDIVRSMNGSREQLYSFGAGPTLTEVFEHADAAWEVVRTGNPKPLAKELIRDTPWIGQDVLGTRDALEKFAGLKRTPKGKQFKGRRSAPGKQRAKPNRRATP